MKKTLGILFKVFMVALVVAYMSLILTEFIRYKHNEPMLIVLKTDKLNYDDGHVYVYYGLGYKSIIYERESINGKEFGHIFIRVRESIPEK